jgi:hypothetical protein
VIGVGLAKPRVRLLGIAASELLVINAQDRFTGLSTIPYSTTQLSVRYGWKAA